MKMRSLRRQDQAVEESSIRRQGRRSDQLGTDELGYSYSGLGYHKSQGLGKMMWIEQQHHVCGEEDRQYQEMQDFPPQAGFPQVEFQAALLAVARVLPQVVARALRLTGSRAARLAEARGELRKNA